MPKEFLTDVQTLRRARSSPSSRVRSRILWRRPRPRDRRAQRRLATELVCVLRYKRHYYTAQGPTARPWPPSSCSTRRGAGARRSDRERIIQLQGEPNFDPEGLASRSHSESTRSSDLVEMVKEDLVAERIAIDSYSEMINCLGDGDPTTRRMIETILAVEEEHADDLLDLLKNMSGLARAIEHRAIRGRSARARGLPTRATGVAGTAIVVIDAEARVPRRGAALPAVEPAVDQIRRLLDAARSLGTAVIHVAHSGRPGGLFAPGSGGEIIEQVAPIPGETVIGKTFPNWFAGTELRSTIELLGNPRLVLCGFMTHMCVSSTASALHWISGSTRPSSATRRRRDRCRPPGSGGPIAAELVHGIALAELAHRFSVVTDADTLLAG